MFLATNLQYLRKKFRMTQEDLSEYLGVSRQSVSKWETGEAYPETDKLIAMCDKFSVTLDALVREDLTAKETLPDPADTEEDGETLPDEKGYKEHIRRFSVRIALGVFLVLIGVALCVAIGGFGEYTNQSALTIGGAVVLLAAVAVATFFFVFAGIEHEKFNRECPVGNYYTKAEKDAFMRKFIVVMAVLVSCILLDVAALVVACALFDCFSLPETPYYCITTSVFLCILALIVGGLVYMGIQHSAYNGQLPEKKRTLPDRISGIIMLTATAIFLAIGFLSQTWHPTWIVFPIGGILCGIISILFGEKK